MINRTSQLLPSEVPRRLMGVEKSVRDMKNKQFMGSDNLVVNESSVGLWTVTLAAGEYRAVVIQVSGSARALYISEFGLYTFINNDLDFTYRWPDGANLTSDLFKLRRRIDYDISLSDEVGSGIKSYVLTLENFGTASKTIYQRYALLFSKGAAQT